MSLECFKSFWIYTCGEKFGHFEHDLILQTFDKSCCEFLQYWKISNRSKIKIQISVTNDTHSTHVI